MNDFDQDFVEKLRASLAPQAANFESYFINLVVEILRVVAGAGKPHSIIKRIYECALCIADFDENDRSQYGPNVIVDLIHLRNATSRLYFNTERSKHGFDLRADLEYEILVEAIRASAETIAGNKSLVHRRQHDLIMSFRELDQLLRAP